MVPLNTRNQATAGATLCAAAEAAARPAAAFLANFKPLTPRKRLMRPHLPPQEMRRRWQGSAGSRGLQCWGVNFQGLAPGNIPRRSRTSDGKMLHKTSFREEYKS